MASCIAFWRPRVGSRGSIGAGSQTTKSFLPDGAPSSVITSISCKTSLCKLQPDITMQNLTLKPKISLACCGATQQSRRAVGGIYIYRSRIRYCGATRHKCRTPVWNSSFCLSFFERVKAGTILPTAAHTLRNRRSIIATWLCLTLTASAARSILLTCPIILNSSEAHLLQSALGSSKIWQISLSSDIHRYTLWH